MAQSKNAAAGQKRGATRPSRDAQPPAKKSRASSGAATPVDNSAAQSPHDDGDGDGEGEVVIKLPVTVDERRPLPTLPTAQSALLSADEYQSIAASAVLHASLERSRMRWVHDGVLERYWVKPETGKNKNARPPPPNNPEVKWQKHKGPCRIRIEPHIFEAEMYVEEKVKPYVHHQSYQQPYRPPPPPQQQHFQNRSMPPVHQQTAHAHSPASAVPPVSNDVARSSATPHPPPSRSQQSPSTPQPQPQQEKKADPVISMLATRASSDPELKALMKEVATGTATQDQLKVFQRHIDELTKMIGDKKKKEDETETTVKPEQQRQQAEMIQYDGPAENTPTQPQPQPQQRPPYQPPAPTYRPPQQTWTPQPPPPPTPTSLPVIFAFTTPGATEDRFLFPQHSILEPLSPQHLLASFLLTRCGHEAADPNLIPAEDKEKEFWQPVTLMVEVAYNREHLLANIKRWVKPAEEVVKYMEEVMGRCERAPEAFLALRLPVKGSQMAAEAEDLPPLPVEPVGEREKEKKGVKYVKKAKGVEVKAGEEGKKEGAAAEAASNAPATAPPAAKEAAVEKKDSPAATAAAPAKDTPAAATPAEAEKDEGEGRPKRSLRKSVRISEG